MIQTSNLLNTLQTRASSQSVKQLELQPGQVYRGTVLKLYPDNMAQVQIGGQQVTAKLETKLEAGQKAWLQVQPSSGMVTLKMLTGSAEAADNSLTGLMNSLGLADTKENRTIMRSLLQQNLPVTKELVQAFSSIAREQGTSEATVDAFLLAFKRKLPLTSEVVNSLQSFLSGKPLSQSIQTFLQQASQFLQAESARPQAGENTPEALVKQVVAEAKDKLEKLPLHVAATNQENEALSEEPAGGAQPPKTQTAVSAGTGQAAGRAAANASTGPQQAADSLPPASTAPQAATTAQPIDSGKQPSGTAGDSQQPTGKGPAFAGHPEAVAKQGSALPQAAAPSLTSGDDAPQLVRTGETGQARPGVNQPEADVNRSARNNAAPQPQATAFPAVAAKSGAGDSAQAPAVARVDERVGTPDMANEAGPSPAAGKADVAAGGTTAGVTRSGAEQPALVQPYGLTDKASPLKEFFHKLGVMHERDIMQHALAPGASDSQPKAGFDNVKSLLLQITQSSSQAVPDSLRDSAEQLLQQITGQQLMLSQQSNTNALAQVVMQVPLRNDQGEETAYVQIESRKQEGGQLDADNCRLFFNLDLQQLGITMVDVSIVNRIVNVQVFNNQPWLDKLAYQMKETFAQQLREVGYHLSGLRVQALPVQQPNTTFSAVNNSMLSDYKGVDIRV
ncbi:hypothetical protein [Brevibacillus fulvus]|uniref:Flagellar hook-length control protein FliK n=1 Tax=Brevibacillus fulvus TaxID=1125967 RepID=A0A938XT24_9BACL|nr:hypothetical protein [Brevibacillus fulvus]MBM7589492.1 hypothetical protein [Brevibacillus fulvus]